MSYLNIHEVTAGYQPGIDVLQGISLQVEPGSLVTIVGPNGAGKSTLLRTIFGFLHPHSGRITLDSIDITTRSPHEIKQFGVSYIPQGINIAAHLTVEENLKLGAWTFRRDSRLVRQRLDEIYERFPLLAERRRVKSTQLSGGQAKLLSIARELMSEPHLLLVDEPTAGLAPHLAEQIYELLSSIRQMSGATIVLVDQHMEAAIGIADYVYLLSLGQIKAHGPRDTFTPTRVRELIQASLMGV